jgi:hypothetical protein
MGREFQTNSLRLMRSDPDMGAPGGDRILGEFLRQNVKLREACRSSLIELLYIAEQTKSRKGGSVWRAIEACQAAIESTKK